MKEEKSEQRIDFQQIILIQVTDFSLQPKSGHQVIILGLGKISACRKILLLRVEHIYFHADADLLT